MKLLVYSALINGLLAAPFLVLIMLVSRHTDTMGDYTNGHLSRILGWSATALMAAAAVGYLALTYGT